jgi:hypothetical protein
VVVMFSSLVRVLFAQWRVLGWLFLDDILRSFLSWGERWGWGRRGVEGSE